MESRTWEGRGIGFNWIGVNGWVEDSDDTDVLVVSWGSILCKIEFDSVEDEIPDVVEFKSVELVKIDRNNF